MNNGCELALVRTGWGVCDYFLVGICGFCSLAEAFASLVILVVTPLLACDLNFGKNSVMTMNAILSLGMAFGGFLCGTFADHNSRRSLMPVTLVVIFCASMCLSFAQKFIPIILAIFLLGFGTAGNNVVLRVYLIECLPARRRGACLGLLDLLWVLGYLVSFAMAWSLVPSVIRSMGNGFRPSSWRVLNGLGGATSLAMACAAGLLPSSPRHLLYRRSPERALSVLQQIYAINNSQHADRYPPCELEGCIQPDEIDDTGSRSVIKAVEKYGMKTFRRMSTIFRPPYTKITMLSLVSRFCLFPGFVWLALWKLHVSHRIDNSMGKPQILNSRANSSTCIFDSADVAQSLLYDCHDANNSRFEYFMLLSMSYIIGETLLFFGIDVVGRRLLIVTSGMIGGTSMVALIFATSHAAQILLSVLLLAAYSIIYTTTSIMILENYPTSVRGTIFGLTLVLPQLAAFFVKFDVSVECTRSIYVVAGLVIGSILAAVPIPDLTRAPMRE